MRFHTFLAGVVTLALSVNAYWLEDVTRKSIPMTSLGVAS